VDSVSQFYRLVRTGRYGEATELVRRLLAEERVEEMRALLMSIAGANRGDRNVSPMLLGRITGDDNLMRTPPLVALAWPPLWEALRGVALYLFLAHGEEEPLKALIITALLDTPLPNMGNVAMELAEASRQTMRYDKPLKLERGEDESYRVSVDWRSWLLFPAKPMSVLPSSYWRVVEEALLEAVLLNPNLYAERLAPLGYHPFEPLQGLWENLRDMVRAGYYRAYGLMEMFSLITHPNRNIVMVSPHTRQEYGDDHLAYPEGFFLSLRPSDSSVSIVSIQGVYLEPDRWEYRTVETSFLISFAFLREAVRYLANPEELRQTYLWSYYLIRSGGDEQKALTLYRNAIEEVSIWYSYTLSAKELGRLEELYGSALYSLLPRNYAKYGSRSRSQHFIYNVKGLWENLRVLNSWLLKSRLKSDVAHRELLSAIARSEVVPDELRREVAMVLAEMAGRWVVGFWEKATGEGSLGVWEKGGQIPDWHAVKALEDVFPPADLKGYVLQARFYRLSPRGVLLFFSAIDEVYGSEERLREALHEYDQISVRLKYAEKMTHAVGSPSWALEAIPSIPLYLSDVLYQYGNILPFAFLRKPVDVQDGGRLVEAFATYAGLLSLNLYGLHDRLRDAVRKHGEGAYDVVAKWFLWAFLQGQPDVLQGIRLLPAISLARAILQEPRLADERVLQVLADGWGDAMAVLVAIATGRVEWALSSGGAPLLDLLQKVARWLETDVRDVARAVLLGHGRLDLSESVRDKLTEMMESICEFSASELADILAGLLPTGADTQGVGF